MPRFTVEGQNEALAAANPPLSLEAVRAGFFETMGVRIVSGRAFTDADRAGGLEVAIVSEEVAVRMQESGDPLGRRIKMGAPNSSGRWLTVVGVAASTRYRDLAASSATLYLPAAQMLDVAQTLAVRTTAAPALVASLARERIRAIDANVHVMSVVPFARTMDAPLARPRFNAFLLNLFGAAALFLAGIGQYAVIAAYVRQREREIALRVALGASPANVRWLVLAEALRLAAIGAVIGLIGAAAVSRLLRGLLYEVASFDPVTLTGAVLLLGARGGGGGMVAATSRAARGCHRDVEGLNVRAFYHPSQAAHDPLQYMRFGRVVAPKDVPARIEALLGALRSLGITPEAPAADYPDARAAVHTKGFLHFLETAWERWQQLPERGPEVWPNTFPYWSGRPEDPARPDCPAEHIIAQAGWYLGDLSVPIGPNTWLSVRESCNTAIAAADAILSSPKSPPRQGYGGQAKPSPMAYALCRPSGHHTRADRASGFCYINNTAAAAQRLRATFKR